MNIKDPNRLTLRFSLFFLSCCLLALWVHSEGAQLFTGRNLWKRRHHRASQPALVLVVCTIAVTCIIMFSVCIHGRLYCVLFKAADLVEALHLPLSITEVCLWCLTLPEGSETNGPTCDAFCLKVTMAITLQGRAHAVVSWCLCACIVCCSVICCVVWACTELICAVLCWSHYAHPVL